jgi:hypothetical protein
LCIAEAHGVDVVLMPWNAKYRLTPFDVIDVDRVVASTCYNLSTVAREAYRPNLCLLVSALKFDQDKHTPKYVWKPRGLRVPILAKSRSIGSDSFSGSVGDKHTMLRIEL